jgi:hypothetical protein
MPAFRNAIERADRLLLDQFVGKIVPVIGITLEDDA